MSCSNCVVCKRCQLAKQFKLSNREMQVIGLICKGEPSYYISETLGISQRTIQRHVSNIFQKMGVRKRTKLAVLAIKLGIADL